jgi:hypothetical protein
MKHINFKLVITSLVINLLIVTGAHALAKTESTIKTIFTKKPTSLAAKSFAVKTFGRNIKILSNKLLESDGCYRIVLMTKGGNRETLKICKK